MSFNVQTVTPAEMDNINWSNVDLLYISGGDGSGSASYGNSNDIKGKTIFDVAKRVHESGFMIFRYQQLKIQSDIYYSICLIMLLSQSLIYLK